MLSTYFTLLAHFFQAVDFNLLTANVYVGKYYNSLCINAGFVFIQLVPVKF